MSTIINALASLSAMGLVFGSGLAYAAKKFEVQVDPKEKAVLEALPGANCGGCGYPGCGGLASAIASGKAPVNGCPVGGEAVAAKIAVIMGVDAGAGEKKVAHVQCNGGSARAKIKADYQGLLNCRAASMVNNGDKECSVGCLGYGSCVSVCAFDAIHVTEDGVALVDRDKCVACGKCIDACPRLLITMIPYAKTVVVDCSNKDKGKAVKDVCEVGCIGCGICEKNCPFDAIHVEGNIARIDYAKCKLCKICVQKCPTKAISKHLYREPKPKVEAAAKPAPVQKPVAETKESTVPVEKPVPNEEKRPPAVEEQKIQAADKNE